MAFPDLVPRPRGVLWSENTGIPDDGNNTFAINIPTEFIEDDEWLNILVVAQGPSVQNASFVSLSADKTQITVNFTQIGNDQAFVRVQLVHSIIR